MIPMPGTKAFLSRAKHIFHNCIMPREGLNGAKLAEACGIEIRGDNKWITLIQNASQKAEAE
jgi:hypothetical protein